MNPLNSHIISEILSRCSVTSKLFREICARGALPTGEIDRIPSCYIVNTDFYYQKGVHWLLIYFLEKKTIFFDSLGLSPDIYNFPLLVERNELPLVRNTQTLQSSDAPTCGHYCIYFLFFFAKGLTLEEILYHFSKENKYINDLYVYNFVIKLVWQVLRKKI